MDIIILMSRSIWMAGNDVIYLSGNEASVQVAKDRFKAEQSLKQTMSSWLESAI
jgi:hypothetical protein